MKIEHFKQAIQLEEERLQRINEIEARNKDLTKKSKNSQSS